MTGKVTLEAYNYALNSLGERQRQVFNCIRDFGPMTNLEISRKLYLPINRVTPRTKEIRQKCLVIPYNTKIDKSGRRATMWQVVTGVK